jgi:phosphatidylglycerol:prolipoprotein diacylglycerol transferase
MIFQSGSLAQTALAFVFTSPGPIIFRLGSWQIRWYGLLIAGAVLLGTSLAQFLARRRHVNPDLLADLAIWLVVGALPCARFYYVLFQWPTYAAHPEKIVAIWEGGIAIHGAILGGLLAAIVFAKVKQVSFWQLADLVAPALVLGQAIGRWGNFFNSEAFGSPTDLPWKLLIPVDRRPPGLEAIAYYHPTFLYESLWNLLVFALLLVLFFRDLKGKPALKTGTLFLLYLLCYSIGRFWIEGLRTDSLMLDGLRVAQVVSLIGITLGTAGLVWLYGLRKALPDLVSQDQSTHLPPL